MISMRKKLIVLLILTGLLFCAGCSKSEPRTDSENVPTGSGIPTDSPSPEPTETPASTEAPVPTETPAPTEAPFVLWDTSSIDLSGIDTSKKLIAFTFDDGPTVHYNTILDILKEHGAHATFFIWGSKYTKTYEDELKRVIAEGSELGNHSWSHKYLTQNTKDFVASDIEKTRSLLESITGISQFLVRPPYGSSNSSVQSVIKVPLVNWSLDTGDWNKGSYESVYNQLCKAKDGDIILMHATYQFTVDAVRDALPYLISEGFQIVSVSELAAAKGKRLISGTAPLTQIR